MCPWNFLHVLLCKCQKTMALFLQILGNIFFGCAPYTSSFLTHYVSEQGLKRTCLRNISLTYPEIWVCTRSWGSGEFSRVFPFSLWTLYVTLLTNSQLLEASLILTYWGFIRGSCEIVFPRLWAGFGVMTQWLEFQPMNWNHSIRQGWELQGSVSCDASQLQALSTLKALNVQTPFMGSKWSCSRT